MVRRGFVFGLFLAALLVAPPAHASSTPKCFGAAARDPRHACVNKRLKVSPTPDEALMIPNLACEPHKVTDALTQCEFGVPADQAVETVALIGDSHALHWRAALAVVAERRHWRVLDVAVPHCLFSTVLTSAGEPFTTWCPQWNADVVAWLTAHPELRTAFVSGNTLQGILVPEGQSGFQTRVDGYVSRWSQLPASLTSLIVIRDNPQDKVTTADCVRRAIRRHQPAGRVCAVRRSFALRTDPAVEAARTLRSRGLHVVDLTDQFCDARVCYPVVGGVLVHRDGDHLTQLFARTLGPFLLRRVNQLVP
jgi:hypothetical protein